MASAEALANSLNDDEHSLGLLYPAIDRIREVSIVIAVKVIRAAQRLGVDRNVVLREMNDAKLEDFVRGRMYHPLL